MHRRIPPQQAVAPSAGFQILRVLDDEKRRRIHPHQRGENRQRPPHREIPFSTRAPAIPSPTERLTNPRPRSPSDPRLPARGLREDRGQIAARIADPRSKTDPRHAAPCGKHRRETHGRHSQRATGRQRDPERTRHGLGKWSQRGAHRRHAERGPNHSPDSRPAMRRKIRSPSRRPPWRRARLFPASGSRRRPAATRRRKTARRSGNSHTPPRRRWRRARSFADSLPPSGPQDDDLHHGHQRVRNRHRRPRRSQRTIA